MFAYALDTPPVPVAVFPTVYGVDFSGARLAGRHAWLARLDRAEAGSAPYRLARLLSLESLCGSAERTPALDGLVREIAASHDALWALGFPFGLPVEVVDGTEEGGWAAQLALLRAWGEDAYGAGVGCLKKAQALGHPGHIRRLTDTETRAPWDTYSYRIIYQTFYGMRDVLGPLAGAEGTATLPFEYGRLPAARRVLVEACPASTLKRLGLPHQGYKQTGAGLLTPARLRARRAILAGLERFVTIGRVRRRLLLKGDNPGDALDAVIAAVGAAESWGGTDHEAVAAHPRYVREGRQYV